MGNWEENVRITDWSREYESNDKWSIEAKIDNPDENNAGMFPIAEITVQLFLQEFSGKYRNNHFIFETKRTNRLELQKICDEFYEKNLKGKELTVEYLNTLSREIEERS